MKMKQNHYNQKVKNYIKKLQQWEVKDQYIHHQDQVLDILIQMLKEKK